MIDRPGHAGVGKTARETGPANSRFGNLPIRAPALAAAFLMASMVCGACNDPYSQRRIAQRWSHFDETTNDITHREADGVRRLDEADQTLKKWWQSDVKRFNERVPTIGDYFW